MERILVIFYTPECGLVLDGQGIAIDDEMKQWGQVRAETLWGPEECPGHGLWIWEGSPMFFSDDEGGQYEFIGGNWRIPTDLEWAHFKLTNTFELLENDGFVLKMNQEITEIMEARS